MKKASHHKAAHHMKQAKKHMDMAHKAMGGTVKEEKKMAKKGDYKGNKAKKTREAVNG